MFKLEKRDIQQIQGLVGPQGPIGPQGPQGVQGPAGPQGLQGPVGPQGLQGQQAYNDYTGIPMVADIITKGPWSDIRAFGVKGDGVTDDTQAIQTAINSANILEFTPNTIYKITGNLLLKSNLVIHGNGATLAIGSQNVATNIFYGRNVSNVTICDLNIIGGAFDKNGGFGGSSNSFLYGIHFNTASHIYLDNIYGKFLDYFIKFDQDVFDVKVSRLRCDLTAMPTFIGHRCYNFTITDCDFNQPDKNTYTLDHRNHPFYMLNCHDIIISNIRLSGGMGFGILVADEPSYGDPAPYNIACSNILIENSWGEATWINGAQNVTIDGLIFRNKFDSGRGPSHINILGGSKNITLSNFQFTGNYTTNNNPFFFMSSCDNVLFNNFIIDSTNKYPLVMFQDGTTAIFNNCIFRNVYTTSANNATPYGTLLMFSNCRFEIWDGFYYPYFAGNITATKIIYNNCEFIKDLSHTTFDAIPYAFVYQNGTASSQRFIQCRFSGFKIFLQGSETNRIIFNNTSWKTPDFDIWTVGETISLRDTGIGKPTGVVCTDSGGAYKEIRGNATVYKLGEWAAWPTGTTVWEVTELRGTGMTAATPPDITGLTVGSIITDNSDANNGITWTCRALTKAAFRNFP